MKKEEENVIREKKSGNKSVFIITIMIVIILLIVGVITDMMMEKNKIYISEDYNNESKYKIGDYVDYTYDTAEPYVFKKSAGAGMDEMQIKQTTNLMWKILNIDEENGMVDLVSVTPTKSNVWLNGVLGYNNGIDVMNEICKEQYSNKSIGVYARSINLLDIEKHLTSKGIEIKNGKKLEKKYIKYGLTKTFTENNWYPSGNTAAQAENGLTVTQTYYFIRLDNKDYFGKASNVLKCDSSYWIASRCTNILDTTSDYACFGMPTASVGIGMMTLYTSKNVLSSGICSLRPVVSIPMNMLSEEKNENDVWTINTIEENN